MRGNVRTELEHDLGMLSEHDRRRRPAVALAVDVCADGVLKIGAEADEAARRERLLQTAKKSPKVCLPLCATSITPVGSRVRKG